MLKVSMRCLAIALIAVYFLLTGCAPAIKVNNHYIDYKEYKQRLVKLYGVSS